MKTITEGMTVRVARDRPAAKGSCAKPTTLLGKRGVAKPLVGHEDCMCKCVAVWLSGKGHGVCIPEECLDIIEDRARSTPMKTITEGMTVRVARGGRCPHHEEGHEGRTVHISEERSSRPTPTCPEGVCWYAEDHRCYHESQLDIIEDKAPEGLEKGCIVAGTSGATAKCTEYGLWKKAKFEDGKEVRPEEMLLPAKATDPLPRLPGNLDENTVLHMLQDDEKIGKIIRGAGGYEAVEVKVRPF